MFTELIRKNRTKRIYDGKKISFSILRSLIEDCRFSASTMNRQDIRYILVNDDKQCDDIFHATNLPSKHGVGIENRPGAFIVLLVDRDINISESFLYYNLGIATANLTLSAASRGLACVTLLGTNFKKLERILSLDKSKKAVSIIAVGKSDQLVEIEDSEGGDISYYEKAGDIHVVPKLTADVLIYQEI